MIWFNFWWQNIIKFLPPIKKNSSHQSSLGLQFIYLNYSCRKKKKNALIKSLKVLPIKLKHKKIKNCIFLWLKVKFQHIKLIYLKVTAGTCITCFLLGLPMVCNGGVFLFTLMDWHTASWAVLLIGSAEVINTIFFFFFFLTFPNNFRF